MSDEYRSSYVAAPPPEVYVAAMQQQQEQESGQGQHPQQAQGYPQSPHGAPQGEHGGEAHRDGEYFYYAHGYTPAARDAGEEAHLMQPGQSSSNLPIGLPIIPPQVPVGVEQGHVPTVDAAALAVPLHDPVRTTCPHCGHLVVTVVKRESGLLSWVGCLGLSMLGCVLGCCLAPFCVRAFQDSRHTCPACRSTICTVERLSL